MPTLAKCPRAVVSLGPGCSTALDGPQKTCAAPPRDIPVSGCVCNHSFFARVAAMAGACPRQSLCKEVVLAAVLVWHPHREHHTNGFAKIIKCPLPHSVNTASTKISSSARSMAAT